MDASQIPVMYLDAIQHVTSFWAPRFHFLENIENRFSPKHEVVDQSITTSNGGCVSERVINSTLK